jgi:hypothetical protein
MRMELLGNDSIEGRYRIQQALAYWKKVKGIWEMSRVFKPEIAR